MRKKEDRLKTAAFVLSAGVFFGVCPSIVLADEPTGNLDSKTSVDVLSLMKTSSYKFKQTLVMITHNNEIAQLADRIIRIEDGKIVQ